MNPIVSGGQWHNKFTNCKRLSTCLSTSMTLLQVRLFVSHTLPAHYIYTLWVMLSFILGIKPHITQQNKFHLRHHHQDRIKWREICGWLLCFWFSLLWFHLMQLQLSHTNSANFVNSKNLSSGFAPYIPFYFTN